MSYAQKIKKLSYEELLVEKEKLVTFIDAYERGIPKTHSLWNESPDPDQLYIHYLKHLSNVSQLLAEKYLIVLSKKVKEKNKEILQ